MKHAPFAVLAAALTLGLGGCAISAIQVQTDLANARVALDEAIKAYGIAKGIADVAVTADPALLLPVTAIEAVIDPLIPMAQTLLADASADAAQLKQVTQQITSQVIAVETSTAQVIKVIPNK